MKLPKRFRPNPAMICIGIIVLLATALFLYKLASITGGRLAGVETVLPPLRDSLRTLWNAPLEAPLTLTRAVVAAISPVAGAGVSRLPNVLLALTVVGLSFTVLKRWYGFRLALFGVSLLVTAPWLLHIGRLATSDILYPVAMLAILLLAIVWHQKRVSRWALYASALLVAAILYTPGMIWLLIVVLALDYKLIVASLRNHGVHAGLAAGLTLTLLIPLFQAGIRTPYILKSFIGLPADLGSSYDIVQAFVQNWQYLFIGGFDNPVYNIAGLAISNVLITVAFFVGVYLYSQHPKAVRSRQLLALWLIGSLLVALGGPVSYAVLLPIVFVLAVGGIGYLLHLWLKTFPNNPYARAFGIGCIGVVVAAAVAYNLQNYFVAWPNTIDTRSAFTRQL